MSQIVLDIVETVTELAVTETSTDISVTETNTVLTLGNSGPQGIQGIQGPVGLSNTLTVGEVTASEPGGDAEVEITGVAPNQTVSFVIPRGLQGIQGEAGIGVQGDSGLSAYEVAIENGFDGTEQEWLDSLVGPKGDTGDTGPAGADSTVPGPQGLQGEPGADSTVPGPQGPAGADSTVPGPKGDTGDTGPGVAAGGTEGQILLKVDGTNYNTIWADNSAESTFYLVRNNTGSTILKGTLLAASGAEPSGRIDVAPFETTGLQDSELRVMGVATANISNGVNGTVMSFGTLRNIDTRGNVASAIAVGDETWAEGEILYAHPTVDGKLTNVRPQHDLAVAFITVRHGSLGQIAVRIVPGNFHLEWLHDVSLNYETITNNQVLTYSTATSLWTAQTQTVTINGTAVALGGTVVVEARLG